MKNKNEINRRKFIRITAGSAVAVGAASGLELEEIVRGAQSFKPLTSDEMARLEGPTKPYYAEANFFKRQHGN